MTMVSKWYELHFRSGWEKTNWFGRIYLLNFVVLCIAAIPGCALEIAGHMNRPATENTIGLTILGLFTSQTVMTLVTLGYVVVKKGEFPFDKD